MSRVREHLRLDPRRRRCRLVLAPGRGRAAQARARGAGKSTRDAARTAGTALGVDTSEELLARARRLTAEQGLDAIYERGDAEIHPFASASFDLVISRFGTMFFADPLAAFRNIARAARPGARLVMMVWQHEERNEWATAIHQVLGESPRSSQLDQFSLADAPAVESLLVAAGFTAVAFEDVREPVYYGPDASAALELVRDMTATRSSFARLDSAAAQRAVVRLGAMLGAHQTRDGVLFEARAWIITALRS